MLEKAKNSASYIKQFIDDTYKTCIILGSGLGELVNSMEIEYSIPYKDIPNFPIPTTEGHKGKLIIGKFGGKNIIAMQGRFHYYEGYDMQYVTFPIKVMKLLNITQLFVSNAAGGVNQSFMVGDIMIITDHINLFPENPLRGSNINELGPRFPSMIDAYSQRIIKIAKYCAHKNHIEIKEGVYAGMQGPSYETPAEYNMLRILGADAVGMSTVPEIIMARHMNIECFGISVITNSTASKTQIKTDHKEVQDVGNNTAPKLTILLREILSYL